MIEKLMEPVVDGLVRGEMLRVMEEDAERDAEV